MTNLLDKVNFLLNIAKNNNCTKDELDTVKELSKEQTDHPRIGRFMGYSVGEYAVATIKWIGENELFSQMYNSLNEVQKLKIDELVEKKIYEQI